MTARVVVDLYNWMPPYGENSVSVKSIGTEVELTVEFDAAAGTGSKTIVFTRSRYFSRGSFPGVGSIEIKFPYESGEFRSGCLLEIENSAFADEWMKNIARIHGIKTNLRHFLIFFPESNFVFHFVCENVSFQ